MTVKRRDFLAMGAAASVGLSAPMVMGSARPKVVLVGGGAGGATAARYLAQESQGALDITLVEPATTYYTCFFSNLYLGGYRDLQSIAFDYGTLAYDYGINVIHDWVDGIDRDQRSVSLARGGALSYDKLVLSPGIDFISGSVPGWDIAAQGVMPHAYKAGTQTTLLKEQVMAMPEGGTFAMIAPPNPYRCPPGPYERISMVAHVLKQSNPTAKILIIDPKEKYSKQALFEEGWQKYYGGMIERIGPDFGATNISVDPASMQVTIDGVAEDVDVCNVIPAQKAGVICEKAGLTEDNWAPVVPHTMQSRMDENIYILGDAAHQGDMPKSGFAANSQAKVAVMSIMGALLGTPTYPARFMNTCWSLIEDDDAVKVGAVYEATDEKIASTEKFISQMDEPPALRQATYHEAEAWYKAITKDMFG